MSASAGLAKKSKKTKPSSKLAEAVSAAEKCKAENPPGVSTPTEKELSPAQFG